MMNYWNYFNANPGVEPAGLLILDDVQHLEQPLRDIFTASSTAAGAARAGKLVTPSSRRLTMC